MQIGVIYPQTEQLTDPDTVRAYARTVEELGYRHVEVYDHVLGADPAVHAGWKGRTTLTRRFTSRLSSTGSWQPSPSWNS